MLPAAWVEAHRIVPLGAGPKTGKWRNFPFQVEPLNSAADPEVSSGIKRLIGRAFIDLFEKLLLRAASLACSALHRLKKKTGDARGNPPERLRAVLRLTLVQTDSEIKEAAEMISVWAFRHARPRRWLGLLHRRDSRAGHKAVLINRLIPA